jgi:threonyl-tRNA synthetase
MTKYNRHYNYVDSKGNNPITDSSLKKIVNKSIKQIEQENKLYYDRVRKNELLIHKYKQTEEYRRELILRATSVDRLCDTQTF